MFEANLRGGKVGESYIARWLLNRGWSIFPVYEIELHTGKGPRLFLPTEQLIAPDMLIFKDGTEPRWVEAKHKTAFTWHRNNPSGWTTGIDIRHYMDYLKVNALTPFKVWIFFLHTGGQAKDSPPNSPSGLFAGRLDYLQRHENHRHQNGGRAGMVYWRIESLSRLGDYDKQSIARISRGARAETEQSPAFWMVP